MCICCVLRREWGQIVRVFVSSISRAGGVRACSSVRTEFGPVCVNMSANLCVCVSSVTVQSVSRGCSPTAHRVISHTGPGES